MKISKALTIIHLSFAHKLERQSTNHGYQKYKCCKKLMNLLNLIMTRTYRCTMQIKLYHHEIIYIHERRRCRRKNISINRTDGKKKNKHARMFTLTLYIYRYKGKKNMSSVNNKLRQSHLWYISYLHLLQRKNDTNQGAEWLSRHNFPKFALHWIRTTEPPASTRELSAKALARQPSRGLWPSKTKHKTVVYRFSLNGS